METTPQPNCEVLYFTESYNALLNKYLHYEFKSEEEENEFLNHIKSLVDDETTHFEDKVAILQFLVGGVEAGWRIPKPDVA